MIITEEIQMNGQTLYRTYSDAGYYIHGGFPEGDYTEAVDPEKREYTETEEKIEQEEKQAIEAETSD